MAQLLTEFANVKKEEIRDIEKKIVTLDDLYEKSKEIAFNTSHSDSEEMWFDDELNFHYVTGGSEKSAQMSFWAYTQMCAKLGISVQYLNKCVTTDKAWAAKNLNYWLKQNKGVQLRIKEYSPYMKPTVISGVTSTRFSTTESVSLVKSLRDELGGDCEVVGSYCEYDRLHIRLTQAPDRSILRKKLKEYGEVGAGMYGGVVVNNSDVGQSALKISYLIYRLACTNGMISTSKFDIYRRSHLGAIGKDTLSKNVSLINQAIAENDEIMSKQVIGAIKAKPTFDDYQKMLTFVKREGKITKADMEKIEIMAEDKYKGFGRAWALINAVTDISHKYDIDRRSELEGVANKLLMSVDKF